MVSGPLEEILDELKKGTVSPLDVLEHEHRGLGVGQSLEVQAPRRKKILLVAGSPILETKQMKESRLDEPSLVRIRQVRLQARMQLGASGHRFLVLDDSGPHAHHLGERPERDAIPVRETASAMPPDDVDQPVDVLLEFP